MIENLDSATGLELIVVPQLALANKDGSYRLIVSSAKKKNGMPVDAENKVNGARALFAAIVERPKVKGRKLKVVVVEEGYATSSTSLGRVSPINMVNFVFFIFYFRDLLVLICFEFYG